MVVEPTLQSRDSPLPRILLVYDVEVDAAALAAFVAPRVPAEVIRASGLSRQRTDVDLILIEWHQCGEAFLDELRGCNCRFGVYGVEETVNAVATCLASGAIACATASCGGDDFIDLLRRASRGAYALSDAALELLAHSVADGRKASGFGRLTARERDTVNLLARGYCNKEIAAVLSIRLPTVKNHLRSAFGKLGVHSRTEALALLSAEPGMLGVGPTQDRELVPKF